MRTKSLASSLIVAGLLLASGLVASGAAFAADATGEWLVEEGVAKIRIENCSNRLWGVVSWEKEPGGLDSNNPDPAKKARPTMGMPILLGMKPEGAKWKGEIYNSENGKTYSASVQLASPEKLKVEGCVLGFLCGGETWTRVKPDVTAANRSVNTGQARPAKKPVRAADASAKPELITATSTKDQICAAVAAQ